MSRGARLAGGAVLGGGLVLAASVFAGPAAFAHNEVVGTVPDGGVPGQELPEPATITEQPDAIAVVTSDGLISIGENDQGNRIQVTGPDGRFYGDGCTTVDGPTASMPALLGAEGTYTVDWTVVSADGHPIDGSWQFDWQPADGVELGAGFDEAPVCGEATETPVADEPAADDPSVAPAEPSAEASEPAQEQEDAAAEPVDAAEAGTDLVWIGAAAAVLVVAGVVLLLVLRRRGARDEPAGAPGGHDGAGDAGDAGGDAGGTGRGDEGADGGGQPRS